MTQFVYVVEFDVRYEYSEIRKIFNTKEKAINYVISEGGIQIEDDENCYRLPSYDTLSIYEFEVL